MARGPRIRVADRYYHRHVGVRPVRGHDHWFAARKLGSVDAISKSAWHDLGVGRIRHRAIA